MLENYLVRATLTSNSLEKPVIGYCCYDGYPFVAFNDNLNGVSFFHKQDDAERHMRNLPEAQTVKAYFRAWMRKATNDAPDINYKLDVIKLTGLSLEEVAIIVVDTLEGNYKP